MLKLRSGVIVLKTKPKEVKLNLKKIKAADTAVSNTDAREVLSYLGTFEVHLSDLVDIIMPAIKDKDKKKTDEINALLLRLEKVINRMVVIWGTATEESDDDPDRLRDTVRGHVADIRTMTADIHDRLKRLFKVGYNRTEVIRVVHEISKIRGLINDIRTGWTELIRESGPMNIRDKIKLIREGKILTIEKADDSDPYALYGNYRFFVVVRGKKGNKIESGWEYRSDAQDQVDDNLPTGEKGKVVAKSALKSLGLDADDDLDWTVGEWWKNK